VSFWSHMLTQTVDLEPLTGVDTSTGAKQYGTKSTGIAARVERNIEVTGESTGATGDTVTRVWLEAKEPDEGDRIHLPDGDVLEVMSTETIPTTDGRTEIYRAQG